MLALELKTWQETESEAADPGFVDTFLVIPHGALWSVQPYLDGIEGGQHGGAASILSIYGVSDLHPWVWYLQEPAGAVTRRIVEMYRDLGQKLDAAHLPKPWRGPKPGNN